MNLTRGLGPALVTLTAATASAALVIGALPAAMVEHAVAATGAKPSLTLPHEHGIPKLGTKGVRVATKDLYAAAFDDATPAPAALSAPGVSANTSVLPSLDGHVPTTCYGTGDDGNRVQVAYAREAGTPTRFADVLPVIRNEIRNVDDVIAASAAKTGGGRRVRWVTDGACQPTVLDVALPAGSLTSSWDTFRAAMAQGGYTAPNRKYLVFGDANHICGLGDTYRDDSPTDNPSDGGTTAMYGRVDSGCWTSYDTVSSAGHELFHTLGAVQLRAPHTTGGGHCFDENDQMCYPDDTGVAMQDVCLDGESLLDCGDDDYFAVNPAPGSWLASHWNTANSSFLADATPLALPATDAGVTGPTTVTVGTPFTLTATATGAATYAWAGPGLDADTGRLASANFTLDSTGTWTVKVRIGLSTGRAVTATSTVTVTPGAAPTGTLTVPDTVTSGTSFPASVAMSTGMDAYTYEWAENTLCVVTDGGATATPTYQCDLAAVATADTTTAVGVTVSQADGQSVSMSQDVSVIPSTTSTRSATALTLEVDDPRTSRVRSLTGALRTSDGAVGGVRVKVQRRLPGEKTWSDVAEVSTAETGEITYVVESPTAATYRLRWGGDERFAASTSRTVLVKTPAALTVSASGTTPVTVTGTLTAGGAAVDGAPVAVQQRPYGTTTWATVAALTTDNAGQATYKAPATLAATYRFTYAGTPLVDAAESDPTVVLKMASTLTTRATGTAPAVLAGSLRVGGAPMPGATVTVQRRPLGTTTWSTHSTLRTSSTGTVTFPAPTTGAASYRFAYAGGATALATTGTETAVRVPTTTAVTASGTWPREASVTLRNKATGRVMPGVAVTVRYRSASGTAYRVVGTYLTSGSGTVTHTTYPRIPIVVSFSYGGSNTYLPVTTYATLTTPTSLSASVRTGRPDALTARLTTWAGTPLSGRRVYVQRRYSGSTTWSTITSATTSSTGYVTTKQQPRRRTYYRFRFTGEPGRYTSRYSSSVYVSY